MISRIDLRGRTLSKAELLQALPRPEQDVSSAAHTVNEIITAVRANGLAALNDYAQRFDKVVPPSLRVPAERIAASLDALAPQVRAGLEEAIRRVRLGHNAQVPKDFTVDIAPGAQIRQRWVPIERVGLYVPGGLAVYPSSVIMNVVPAQAAGVSSIAVVSPPQVDNDGYPDRVVLAACALLGVEEVYAVGGAQAIAALAYGISGELEPVDLITGPGNVFVTAAKRQVQSVVGIDSEAGPTEIMVLADSTANAEYVAADLISQAEHDPLAASVLVTWDEKLAQDVVVELEKQSKTATHAERITTALGGKQSAIVLVDDLETGIRVANAYGAEHLEIHTADAAADADRITAAGAIFVGPYSPVPLGDYSAGSNHVLPTGGAARHSAGLGVHNFVKPMQIIEYDADALAEIGPSVIAVANAERLPAHGYAIAVRHSQR